jgi:hypothetical protein
VGKKADQTTASPKDYLNHHDDSLRDDNDEGNKVEATECNNRDLGMDVDMDMAEAIDFDQNSLAVAPNRTSPLDFRHSSPGNSRRQFTNGIYLYL